MKRIIAIALAVACVGTVSAQEWARERLDQSPRHPEWAKVKSGSRQVEVFTVFPEVKDKVPAVLLIHEIFGLTDWARELADEVAAAGYIAVAPDLLSGMGPAGSGTGGFRGRDAAVRAVSSLPPDQVTADLNAAAEYASHLPACNGKLVVAGFCWGGSQTFRYATNNPHLEAAFVFYGTGPTSEAAIGRIQCPVYGFYGGNDARVNATIATSAALMKKAGKTFEPVTYEGAGHGFMRAGEAPDASEANRQARDEAWKRWKKLLAALR